MVCRVCLLNVKKSAVLCSECSLIAHAKCAKDAPPTCDLRAQLLLYAQYAEKGNPSSVYQNPVEFIGEHPGSPMSDVAFVARSPRSSLDTPNAHTPASPPPVDKDLLHPPTAFKFVHAFKHKDKGKAAQSQSTPEPSSSNVRPKGHSNLHKDKDKDAEKGKTKDKKAEKAKAEKADDPKAGADIGKIVNLMAGDANRVSRMRLFLFLFFRGSIN